MNLFQIMAVVVLGTAILWEGIRLLRSARGRGLRAARLFVWLSASAAIAYPEFPQRVAEYLGIGRGADAVLYLFVLAFLWVSFFLYSRQLRLQRQITQLTRHLAIRDAQHGNAINSPSI